MEELYYIQDKSTYHGNAIVWWGIDNKGYTSDLTKAGKYTKEYINSHTWRSIEAFWPCEYIDNLQEAKKIIVDMQYVDKYKSEKLGKII